VPTATPSPTTAAQRVDHLLQDAVEATLGAGTVSLTLKMRFVGSTKIPEATEITGSGQLEFAQRRRASLTMDMSAVEVGTIAMIVDEPDLWLQFDGVLSRLLPDGKKWAHIGERSTGGFAEAFRTVLSGPNDSTLMVYYLLGTTGDGRVLGEEEVDGVHTTHVASTLDLEVALDRVPADVRDALVINIDEVRKQGIEPKLLGEAWIGPNGLIHRQRLEYSLSVIQRGGAMLVDIGWSDHGQALNLPIPPESETVEADDITMPS
jgi:hypothetical protein